MREKTSCCVFGCIALAVTRHYRGDVGDSIDGGVDGDSEAGLVERGVNTTPERASTSATENAIRVRCASTRHIHYLHNFRRAAANGLRLCWTRTRRRESCSMAESLRRFSLLTHTRLRCNHWSACSTPPPLCLSQPLVSPNADSCTVTAIRIPARASRMNEIIIQIRHLTSGNL